MSVTQLTPQKPMARLTHPMVTVCVPFGRNPLPQWAISFASIAPPINAITAMDVTMGMVRDEARHSLALGCVKTQSKYMLCLDDDVTVPSFILRKLIYAMQIVPEDVMAIGGIYCTKTTPAMPAVFQHLGEGPYYGWNLGEIFECEVAPLGMMLVKTEVFKHLPQPWFKDVDGVDEAKALGLVDESSDTQHAAFTDDAFFCHKIRQAGFRVMAHGGVLGVHWDSTNGTAYILPNDAPPIQREMERRWGKEGTDAAEYWKRVRTIYSEFHGPMDLVPGFQAA